MRTLFTTEDAARRGISSSALRWGEKSGRWRRVSRGVYAEGREPPTRLDRARADAMRSGLARGDLAGVLLGLDSVRLGPTKRRRPLSGDLSVVQARGQSCTDGLQTLLDLSTTLDDDTWEQALESALRRQLCREEDLWRELAKPPRPGHARIRRVLKRRGNGVPATESLLETLMVQLARTIPNLPPPVRQYEVFDEHGQFVARVDLCWPELGLFIELDGQQHKGQPVYDARRETAVVAATGWLCGRFTWDEVVRTPVSTARRLARLVGQAQRRPLAS